MKFKDLKFSDYVNDLELSTYYKYKIIIVFNDNKKALIIKPYSIRKLFGDFEVLYVYTIEDYINEEYCFYIHLNIYSEAYKKILGY